MKNLEETREKLKFLKENELVIIPNSSISLIVSREKLYLISRPPNRKGGNKRNRLTIPLIRSISSGVSFIWIPKLKEQIIDSYLLIIENIENFEIIKLGELIY